MCLVVKHTNDEKKAWLDAHSDTITVYKKVYKSKGKYYPLFFSVIPYTKNAHFETDKENKLDDSIKSLGLELGYDPYFHFFEDRKEARKFYFIGNTVLKCKVRKEDITVIGQHDKDRTNITVVAKAFTIERELVFNRF